MRLCFGTFAMVLNCCSQNIQQAALIARLVRIVDPESRYLGENRYKKDEEIVGDGPAISKLLHCKIDFAFSDIKNISIMQDKVAEQIKSEVAPFIIDKKAKVILALLDIIRQDECIDSEKEESFIKFFGLNRVCLLRQSKVIFSDFLAKVFLYTIRGDIDNRVGSACVKTITSDYIDDLSRPYIYDIQWNEALQELTLSFLDIFKIFNQAVHDYQIDGFIEKVDPTSIMNYEWIEVCDRFLKFTEEHIWIPFTQDLEKMNCKMLKMVQEFAQTLDEYTKYLGINMRPIEEKPDIFVPLYRDENVKWALEFEKHTRSYRQRIISIYQEIYRYTGISV